MKIKNSHVNFQEADNECGPQEDLHAEVDKEFAEVDSNDDGEITWDELHAAVEHESPETTEEEWEEY